LDACIALRRPVLVRESLLGHGIDGLDAAHSRGQLFPWQEPLDALRRLPALSIIASASLGEATAATLCATGRAKGARRRRAV
jgi:hypothetical protein